MKKILVVVDYQNDFIDGVLAVPEADKIKNFIQNEINGDYEKVFYTLDTHIAEDYAVSDEQKLFPNIHCEFNTDGWNLGINTVRPILADKPFQMRERDNEVIFCKDKFDIFEGNDFYADYIKEYQDYEIVLVGVATNYCVYTHAIGLINRGFNVTVLKDGVKGIMDYTYETRVQEMIDKGVQWK